VCLHRPTSKHTEPLAEAESPKFDVDPRTREPSIVNYAGSERFCKVHDHQQELAGEVAVARA